MEEYSIEIFQPVHPHCTLSDKLAELIPQDFSDADMPKNVSQQDGLADSEHSGSLAYTLLIGVALGHSPWGSRLASGFRNSSCKCEST